MIVILGTPGAGKTTVLAKAKEGLGCSEINYGDLMIEIAREKGYAKGRDEMRKMPLERQKAVQSEVAKKLSEMKGRIILNTHALVSTPAGYLPGLSMELLENAGIEQLLLIISPPKDIIRRRKEDTTRARDQETEAQLQEILDVNKSYLFAYSAVSGAPAAIVENADGKLEEAVQKTRRILGERWND